MRKIHKKIIPWWMPQVGKEEYHLIKEVLDDNYPNQGKRTALFEQKIGQLLGVKHAIATTSGTAAIMLGLKAVGVGKGDEVIVPDMTFIATANAAELAGANVVLVDVDPNTLNIDPKAFRAAITKRTKAVVPVHVSGRGVDMESIIAIARKAGIAVVEDAAEAFMSKHKGKYLGTIGDVGCFSLSPNKTITSGQGGLTVTNSDAIAKRLWQLKNQGVVEMLTGGDDIHPTIGYNFRMTDLQAALALGQLSYLKKRLARMRRTHELYRKYLGAVPGIKLLPFNTKAGEIPQWTDILVSKRKELDAYLREQGMICRRFWFPLHTQAPYQLPDAKFPVSTRVAPQALWLPSAFTMTDQDVKAVSDALRDFFN